MGISKGGEASESSFRGIQLRDWKEKEKKKSRRQNDGVSLQSQLLERLRNPRPACI